MYYNRNPWKLDEEDCVCRAISAALDIKYVAVENLLELMPNAHFTNFERLYMLACRFIEMQPDEPQIFYIWGHSYEMDADSTYRKQVEDFFRFISNRDDIFYGTNKEVLL